MRVLLDTCVWGGAKNFLSLSEHDVVWAGDWERDPFPGPTPIYSFGFIC